jgi:urease accessory protein
MNRDAFHQTAMPDTVSIQPAAQSSRAQPWHAELALGYDFDAGRSVLARRHHRGPLVVQKALYPEGGAVCHTIVVHPPGGIAGGDRLEIRASAGSSSHALLTTPGAAKWYRANGREASQSVSIEVGEDAIVEWLPQEAIVFDAARARIDMTVELRRNARYLGWDITVLGRRASGERFESGALRQATSIRRDGRELYAERARLEGGDALLHSPAGLAGCHVLGTLVAAAGSCGDALLGACRELAPEDGARHGVTRLPEVLVARYLGGSPQAARLYFGALWATLRPWFAGREACPPRIWQT